MMMRTSYRCRRPGAVLATALASAGLLAVPMPGQARPRPAAAPADLVLINADIRSQDPAVPQAQALAVRAGKFVALGDNARALALKGPRTQVIDAHGATVVPGLIDGHTHLAMGSDLVTGVDLSYIPDKATWLRKIKERSDQLPKGAWLVGGGWDYTLAEGKYPTRQDIDAVVPDRPVFLQDIDGHTHWANTLALKMAGITAQTKVPDGGEIVLDPATGEPTGILKEGASELIMRQPGLQRNVAQRREALRQTVAYANSLGLTGIHDMAGRNELYDYLALAKAGTLNVRVWYGEFNDDPAAIRAAVADRTAVARAIAAAPATRTKGPTLAFGYIKTIIDGVLSTHTAVLEKDYSDREGWRGKPFRSQADLEGIIAAANGAGFPMAVHAIGDGGVHTVLNAYEAARKPLPAGLHNRIEHIEVLEPDDLARFPRLDVVASMQPNHATGTIGKYIDQRIGLERENWAYVWQKMLKTGVPLVFGSDWPTSPLNPLAQINDAVFRESPFGLGNGPWHAENAVSFDQALHAYTQAGANMTIWANQIGSITPGKWADFVVLDARLPDPLDRTIRQRHVARTYLAGRIVFDVRDAARIRGAGVQAIK